MIKPYGVGEGQGGLGADFTSLVPPFLLSAAAITGLHGSED